MCNVDLALESPLILEIFTQNVCFWIDFFSSVISAVPFMFGIMFKPIHMWTSVEFK